MTDPLADRGAVHELSLLFVCTANRCRSPIAAAMASKELQRRGIRAHVTSRGLLQSGQPAASGAVRVMGSRGLDLSRHRSRSLDQSVVNDSLLILAMERRHLVEVAKEALTAVDRTFTLIELARICAAIGPRRPNSSLSSWIAEASAMRDPSHVLGYNTDDDIKDPMGGSRSDYRRTADEIDRLTKAVLDHLFRTSDPA